jgi:hypothetical protein
LAGFNFADGRGNITLSGSYDNDHGLRSRNRSFSAHDDPNRSSYAAQGLFSLDGRFSAANGQTFTFDQNNQVKPYQGANIDGYDRNQQRYLSLPVNATSAARWVISIWEPPISISKAPIPRPSPTPRLKRWPWPTPARVPR